MAVIASNIFSFLIASKLARSDPTSSIVSVGTLLKDCVLKLHLTYN